MTDTDIVTRLRDYYTSDADSFRIEHPICQEAADEIERLRAALAERAEECAKVAEDQALWKGMTPAHCAQAIRAKFKEQHD